jgi:3-mercaptopyruvate sulfurtransferase SseA
MMTRRPTLLAAALLVGALLGCESTIASSGAAKKPAPAPAPTPNEVAFATPTPAPAVATTNEIPRISPADAADAAAKGTAVIVDVRENAQWEAGHVKGALHVSLAEIEAGHLDQLPRDRRIIAYCS